MDGFSAGQWAQLTDAERIQYCHMASREAAAFAQSASPALRETYKTLASQWLSLAAEIERENGRSVAKDSP
jgi:hypothetical protein